MGAMLMKLRHQLLYSPESCKSFFQCDFHIVIADRGIMDVVAFITTQTSSVWGSRLEKLKALQVLLLFIMYTYVLL